MSTKKAGISPYIKKSFEVKSFEIHFFSRPVFDRNSGKLQLLPFNRYSLAGI